MVSVLWVLQLWPRAQAAFPSLPRVQAPGLNGFALWSSVAGVNAWRCACGQELRLNRSVKQRLRSDEMKSR